jgi:hypothetical protein
MSFAHRQMASNYHFWKKEAEELDHGGHICQQPKLCYGDVRVHVLVDNSLISHTLISIKICKSTAGFFGLLSV